MGIESLVLRAIDDQQLHNREVPGQVEKAPAGAPVLPGLRHLEG